jgi:hypothetical protein
MVVIVDDEVVPFDQPFCRTCVLSTYYLWIPGRTASVEIASEDGSTFDE